MSWDDVPPGNDWPRMNAARGEGEEPARFTGGFWLGFVFVFISTFFFSLVSVLIKCDKMPSGEVVSTVEIAISRAVAGMVLSIAGLKVLGMSIFPNYLDRRTIWIALLRGALDFLASNCFYFACAELPISVATVIYFTNPFWAGGLSWIVLNEDFGLRRMLLTLLAVLGVMISVFPDLGRDISSSRSIRVTSLVAALCGSFLQAGQYVAGRIITTNGIHWLHANLGYSVAGLCLAPALLAASTAVGEEVVSPSLWSVRVWTITSLIVVFALLAQASLILGVSVLEASVTAVVRTLDIPLAMCWAYYLLEEVPEGSQILGSGVLVVACALFAVGSGRPSMPGTPSVIVSEGSLENQLLPASKSCEAKLSSNPQAGDVESQ
jgi:drug/metabolite transporter (DMT)-like permease